jgi:zinc protease
MSLNPPVSLLRTVVLAICMMTAAMSSGTPALGQTATEPQREQLLNGLRVLIWSRPGDQDVLIKLRIHSGAAFDIAGKGGGMAILGDILFPDPTTREFFTDDMAGRLEIDTDYDSITVTMQGRANEFVRFVEILRTALTATQITESNVAKIRGGRIKIAKETNLSPAILADRAIAARLFGDFPYGRPSGGSAESLARIDRADLLLARDRFLNPNNATLVIIGGVQKNSTMRALRQLLGSWRKSEQIVPATFRQPEPPDARTLIINAPAEQSAEVRLAVRGLARSDRDFPAAAVIAIVARKRWEASSPELSRMPLFVRNEARVLPGMFVMGAAVDSLMVGKTLKTARDVLKSMISSPVTNGELEQVKNEILTQMTKDREKPDGTATAWLDIDTFGLPAISEQTRVVTAVSVGDIQRVITRLIGEDRLAAIVTGDSKQLKAQLEPNVKIELMGEVENRPPEKTESKPATTIPVKKPD